LEVSKRQVALGMLALLFAGASQAQTVNPLTAGARLHYGIIKGYVLRAAPKMPEEQYGFRPVPEVRTFAQRSRTRNTPP
jgi:hypothetical protein